jgi:hypothetical protein
VESQGRRHGLQRPAIDADALAAQVAALPDILERGRCNRNALEWADQLALRRLLGPIGNISPVEFEQLYYV